MDELQIIYANDQWLEGATIHFAAMTTFVAIYIAALYVFLRNAPFAVRLIAYTFFVGTFIVFVRLGVGFLENVFVSYDIIAQNVDDALTTEAFREWRDPKWYDAIPVGLLWYALVTMTVIALGWLTFFFSWKQKDEE